MITCFYKAALRLIEASHWKILLGEAANVILVLLGTLAPITPLVAPTSVVASFPLLMTPSCLIPILIVVIAASSLVPFPLVALALTLALLLWLRLQEYRV